ncbi:MauE/DoxX family redox-associated membrane protein [Fluctibacter corallii]|uniref:MauE/DoxX family redox-associated membrane protein n=1 Tax=Fluctibacter corallii TaxID=2984329 RepID=UPI00384FAC47
MYASYSKLRHFDEFKANLEISFYVPSAASFLFATGIIATEACVAILLLAPPTFLPVILVASALFAIFLLISIIGTVSDNALTCNCFGETDEINFVDAIRNSLLFLSCLFVWYSPPLLEWHVISVVYVCLSISLLLVILNIKPIVKFLGLPLS